MSQITIDGVTLNFKDSAFTGDQWEQVAGWVLNDGAQMIEENAQTATEKAKQATLSASDAAASATLAKESADEAKSAAEAMQECAPYDATKTYAVGNMVTRSGSTYRCIAACTGVLPPNAEYWLLIAQKGADGTGAGDMTKTVYDPDSKEQDVFGYADQAANAVQLALNAHAVNTDIHVTTTEKDAWNGKAEPSDIPTNLSELAEDSAHRLVSDAEKTTWGNKADKPTTKTATLLTTGWNTSTLKQTVSVDGVTASAIIIITAAPDSYIAYAEAGIRCTAQGAGTLTFTCEDTPTEALAVNVLILG